MSFAAAAAAGTGLLGAATSFFGSKSQGAAAKRAARAQVQAAQAGITAQGEQFDKIATMLAPFVMAGKDAIGSVKPFAAVGPEALSAERNLIGLGGADAQSAAIDMLSQSPEFQALTQRGENAILQNAAATGGLRGGNVQAALAQFRPQLLAQLIKEQFGRLSGLSTTGLGAAQNLLALGQSAAGTQGQIGFETATNIANLFGQQGASKAGGIIAAGNAQANALSGLTGGLGLGLGTFKLFK